MRLERVIDFFKRYITLTFEAVMDIFGYIEDSKTGFVCLSRDLARTIKIEHQLILVTMSVLVGRMIFKGLPCSFLIQFETNRITRTVNQTVHLRILRVVEWIRCHIIPALALQCVNDLKNSLLIGSLVTSERNQFLKIRNHVSSFILLHGAFLL